jgi:hypothetical protein
MSKAHVADVVGQFNRQFAIGERSITLFRDAHPGTEMHLVDGHRCLELVVFVSGTHPLLIAPFVGKVPDDRSCARRNFVVQSERISLVDRVHVITRTDVELVHRPLAQIRDERLPHARTRLRVHGSGIGIPAVELAHKRYALRIGRPNREMRAAPAIHLHQVGPELLEQPSVLAFIEQMQVIGRQHGGTLFLGRKRCHSLNLLAG